MGPPVALAVLVLIGCGGSPPPAPVAAPVVAVPDDAQAEPVPAPETVTETEPDPEPDPAQPVSTSTTPTVRWALIIRAPDGTETHRRSDPLPTIQVEGTQCSVHSAGVEMSMSMGNGPMTQRTTETRELACGGGPSPRTATARCTVETTNGVSSTRVEPATIDLGNPRRPTQVTLKCSVQ